MNKLETTFDKLTKNKNIHECVAYRTQQNRPLVLP